MLDYARLNRSVLGSESILCLPDNPDFAWNPLLKKWKEEFEVILYRDKDDLGRVLKKEGAEVIYLTKPGPWDGFLVPGVRNCVHAQFLCDEYHGEAYAYLSPWMSQVMTGRKDSYVPFYVPKLESKESLRTKLGILPQARVFGRHGGWDTFNIPFVRKGVTQHARQNPEDHFVFLNTEPIRGTEKLRNIHYLPATVDADEKAAFLATCDVMLHARWHGETFGLAVGEFAVLGKPVITFSESRERAHLEMLGNQALLYRHAGELAEILREFRPHKTQGTQYEIFSDPKIVIRLFQKKFLED
jgi:glycosyltransferase involved in cell wall biosynthesis